MIKISEDHLYAKINKALDGRATIGGGALRSYFEGNTPRDIDIFMSSNDETNFKEVVWDVLYELILSNKNPSHITSKNGYFTDDYSIYTDGLTSCIISFIVPQELTGRLLYGSYKELANEYDLSPVRCVLLSDNTIYFADGEEEYFKLFNSKQMKVRGDVQSQDRTLKRIKKYEGYGYNLIGEI